MPIKHKVKTTLELSVYLLASLHCDLSLDTSRLQRMVMRYRFDCLKNHFHRSFQLSKNGSYRLICTCANGYVDLPMSAGSLAFMDQISNTYLWIYGNYSRITGCSSRLYDIVFHRSLIFLAYSLY